MKLKKNKCPNCGANLVYDSRKHKHVCEYCGGIFEDESQENAADPRVELTPDDLKQFSKNSTNSHMNSNVAIVFIVIGLFLFFSIVSFIMISNMMLI